MDRMQVGAVDYHTAGEPFRIVSGGVPRLAGKTILDKRRYASEHLDHIRQLLVFEPRGHADMYGWRRIEEELGTLPDDAPKAADEKSELPHPQPV